MKKILMVGINARFSHPNLALHYLREYVRPLNVHVQIREFTIKESAPGIVDYVLDNAPDLLLISVYIWNSTLVKEVLKELSLRNETLPRIVLGGPEVSYNSRNWIEKFSCIDHIISGPGEESFRKIVSGEVGPDKMFLREETPPFDKIPFPYIKEDFQHLQHKIIYYESSRGCPFRCSYCLSSREDQKIDFRNMEKVFRELDFLCDFKVRVIKFIDRTFNWDRNRALEIWKYISENLYGRGIVFHFEVHPELLRDEDLEYLATVPRGLFQFEVGIQSVNRETLREIRRSFNIARALERVRVLCSLGNIDVHTDIIAGLPLEGLHAYIESFNRVYECGGNSFQPGILKILPGTAMSARAQSYGMRWSEEAPYEVTETQWLTGEEMNLIKRVSNITGLIANSGHFVNSLEHLLELWGSAWDFFRAIAEESLESVGSVGVLGRDRESICALIMQLVGKHFPGEIDYVTDLLIQDWSMTAKSHRFPEILRNNMKSNAKKTGYRYFIEQSKGGVINTQGVVFNSSDLKRAMFHIPLSARFRREFSVGYGLAVLPSKEILHFPSPNG